MNPDAAQIFWHAVKAGHDAQILRVAGDELSDVAHVLQRALEDSQRDCIRLEEYVRADGEPECTCYESHGGHMPGCPHAPWAKLKRERDEAVVEAERLREAADWAMREDRDQLLERVAVLEAELVVKARELADWHRVCEEAGFGHTPDCGPVVIDDSSRFAFDRWCKHQRAEERRRIYHPNSTGSPSDADTAAAQDDTDRAFAMSLAASVLGFNEMARRATVLGDKVTFRLWRDKLHEQLRKLDSGWNIEFAPLVEDSPASADATQGGKSCADTGADSGAGKAAATSASVTTETAGSESRKLPEPSQLRYIVGPRFNGQEYEEIRSAFEAGFYVRAVQLIQELCARQWDEAVACMMDEATHAEITKRDFPHHHVIHVFKARATQTRKGGAS